MRFIHTADWHAGRPFETIPDEAKRALVRNQRIETIRRIGEKAREQDAGFIVVAGDVFDSNTPDSSTVSALCSAVGEIGLPVIAIPGNHDYGGPGSIYEQAFFQKEAQNLAPNLRIILKPEPVEVNGAVILACPCLFGRSSMEATAWLNSKELTAGLPVNRPRIILAHGSIYDFSAGSEQFSHEDEAGTALSSVIDLDQIPEDLADYIALGDWHGTKQVHEKAWYSGTHEPDRFPRHQNYSSGNVLLVDLIRGGTPTVKPLTVGEFRWTRLSFHFSSDTDIQQLNVKINELTGGQVGKDLMKLLIEGYAGMETIKKVGEFLETLKARFLMLSCENRLRLRPDDHELMRLKERRSDPIISSVAARLVEEMERGDDERTQRISSLALIELYNALIEGEYQ